ncbi:alpha/beta family hydrolase [Candidatus Palauibacter sp.]|uniref:alpha/beta hydrolase family protein n=1 Tax=Candidatus Palauibacter sp. TaxID=3101350 RepID=UPI003B59EDC2
MTGRAPRAAAEVGATHRFPEQAQFVSLRWGEVSALLVRPTEPRAMLAFAHGAGAGIEHPFMGDMAQRLAGQGIASFRYHFPYMEARALSGRRRPPDRPPVLVETVRAAVAKAARLADGLPLLAGGKSMGGRMTSTAAAEDPLPGVAGLVFFGFPLHAPGRPERAAERSAHLSRVTVPMLFLQGTRDALARLDLIEETCASLGPLATLHRLDGADHSFRVLKRSGRTADEVADEMAATVPAWTARLETCP